MGVCSTDPRSKPSNYERYKETLEKYRGIYDSICQAGLRAGEADRGRIIAVLKISLIAQDYEILNKAAPEDLPLLITRTWSHLDTEALYKDRLGKAYQEWKIKNTDTIP